MDKEITSLEFVKKLMSLAVKSEFNNDKSKFITEEEGIAHLYYKKDEKFYVRIYNNTHQTIEEILSDDYFCESIIEYYILDKKADHITDILHWYAESDWDIKKIVFSLDDILNCGYIG